MNFIPCEWCEGGRADEYVGRCTETGSALFASAVCGACCGVGGHVALAGTLPGEYDPLFDEAL